MGIKKRLHGAAFLVEAVIRLLDFGFTERHVLTDYWVVLAHFHLAGCRTSVLLGDVEVSRFCGRDETNLNDVSLCHVTLGQKPLLVSPAESGTTIQQNSAQHADFGRSGQEFPVIYSQKIGFGFYKPFLSCATLSRLAVTYLRTYDER